MGYAYPTTAHNDRAVTPREYEELVHPYTPDGLIGHPSDEPLVYADSTIMGVQVRAGRSALIRGLRWVSETGDTVPLDRNTTSGSTRIDLIVLRMTRNPWNAGLAVIKGVPSPSPLVPSPTFGENTSTGVWELPVAEVTVPYNASTAATVGPGQVVNRAWYVGGNGQLLCTSETRPVAPTEGTVVFETDTDLLRVWRGSAWRTYGVDLDVCPAVQVESTNAIGSITSTAYAAGNPQCGLDFVAPQSGKVFVTVSGVLSQSASGNNTRLGWEVRSGATVGSGTVVWGTSSVRGIAAGQAVVSGGPAQAQGSHRYLVDGLTPGNSYNVRTMHAVTGGTGSISYRSILVEPVVR
ncbi:hypothetical protein [Melissospora conviva]|uniref:hypothetical protein n=1 Tax=Melissospora conviva TaxID=3388432 RepID=UPI003C14BFB7